MFATSKDYYYSDDFSLERGDVLKGFKLHYTTYGRLNEHKSNAIWVCHALTANSDVFEWWPGLFSKGAIFDADKYFVICANMIGGCYGSTGPLSINDQNSQPYYHEFPQLTNLDIVKAFDLLRVHLDIPQIHTIIGGSMGGQQALEWSILKPDVCLNLVGLATNAVHSPWGIAFNESQRMAISQDKTWTPGGPNAGSDGLETARAIALLSYRSYDIYHHKQLDDDGTLDDFRAASYQRYQGDKLRKRFNAYTYWLLSKAMDAHNVGRNRKDLTTALGSIKANCHFIGISSDILFPVEEQRFLATHIEGAQLSVIDSLYGHDGFLVETEKINNVLVRSFQEPVK